MKRLIKRVVLRRSDLTVFTTYEFKGKEYQGYNVYDTLAKAEEAAQKLVDMWDVNFMSITKKYELI